MPPDQAPNQAPNQARTTLSFLAKLLVISGAISYGLKFGGPLLSIPATTGVALGIVLLPPLGMALVLLRRGF
ncbi:MAG: hypothetical protein HC824_00485 [Synechococcales cyanobacterium RM1_1_8]|nr:hypothetical protein [Synechococcales cyanobacterium RM1_1_8]